MSTQTQSLPPLSFRAAFQPSTVNREKRTVELVWTTGSRVLRGLWERFWEELSLDPAHVRMDRLGSGKAPFLMNHDANRVQDTPGVIERAWLTKSEGRAVVRFVREGVDPEADRLFEKIADGITTQCSVGYRVHKMEKIADGADKLPVYRAVDWQPFEVSSVAIGADAGASTRSEADTFNPCEVITRGEAPHLERNEMSDTTNALELERTRCAELTKLCKRSKLDDLGEEMIRNGTPLDQARAMVLDALATRSESYAPNPWPSGAVEVVATERDDRVRTLGAALASRAGCTSSIPEAARQYARLSMVDMARICLEARGKSTRLMSGAEIIRAAHTTSDFPALLGEAGNRVLLDGYNAYAGGVKQISRKSSARDFRAKSLLRLGEFPALLKVAEHGEVKSGTIAEAKESYSLATFARIFALTRQAIINDDMGAFEMVRLYGRAAAELEAAQLVGLLTSNPAMGDGQPLFSTAHGNLAAAGGAISIPTLGEALRAMRTQKGLDKKTPINVIPRFLVVPAALEVVALQVTAEINATQASDVNPFTGRLVPIVDPRLDLHSATAWYVAADPALAPALEHSYLEGEEGPALTEQQGFEVMGTQWRVHMDFGCGVVSHEGLYKNPGA
jgi:hypothetical protein